jgi:hypothetical protein
MTPLALEQRANAGFCRQLSNAYLNYSNVNVLPTEMYALEARPAVLVEPKPVDHRQIPIDPVGYVHGGSEFGAVLGWGAHKRKTSSWSSLPK